MKRLTTFSLLVALVAFFVSTMSIKTAAAQDWAKERLDKSPRHRDWEKLKHGDRELDAYIVYPEVKEKATAVVVIHEIFGLSDWAKELTDELAEAGYIAIAPDLLSGAGPNKGGTDDIVKGGGDVGRLIRALPVDQVTADLNAAAEHVAKLPACNGKVVVCGFCWGGGEAFRFATNNKNLKAAFVFYGWPDRPALTDADVSRIACPVYGFYAGNDNRIDATIPTATELMKKAGKTYEPVTYEGAGHGFMRAGEQPNPNEANKKARDEAWARWKELLKKS